MKIKSKQKEEQIKDEIGKAVSPELLDEELKEMAREEGEILPEGSDREICPSLKEKDGDKDPEEKEKKKGAA